MNDPTTLTVPVPQVPAEVLPEADADRLSAYVAQAVREAVRDWLTEHRISQTFEREKNRHGYDGALGECYNRHGVSVETARRIVQGRWARQPENRAA